MNTLELSKAIGKTALLRTGSFQYEVRISDAKMAYGNVRYLVSPVSGMGSVWVDSNRLTIQTEDGMFKKETGE